MSNQLSLPVVVKAIRGDTFSYVLKNVPAGSSVAASLKLASNKLLPAEAAPVVHDFTVTAQGQDLVVSLTGAQTQSLIEEFYAFNECIKTTDGRVISTKKVLMEMEGGLTECPP